MAKLVTGGTGYIGSEVARILADRGEEVVIFDVFISHHRIDDFRDKVKIVQGDLSNFSEVLNVVKEHNIQEIYHFGSMLSYISEQNPWASFQVNVIGTYNVLEAARLFGIEKVMFSSTLGTFGLDAEPVLTDTTLQRPINFYGCGKLYCEGLGRWYNRKFGLDFRSIRYALMIGPNVRTPGHWAPAMIEDAIMGRSNEMIYGFPESAISMIYIADAARAAVEVLQAPKEDIGTINYNVAGIREVVSARKMENNLRLRFPEFLVTCKPDPNLKPLGENAGDLSDMKVFDDSCALEEWGWTPQHDNVDKIIDAFEKDIKDHPERYGLL